MVAASSKVTAKKRRANRRNAKKSTGPRTAAGKAVASKNATSHGIYCRDVVLDGENQATFLAIRESYIDRLRPQDGLELSFVDRVAHDQWKLNRLQAAEKNLYEFRRQAHIDLFDQRRKGELDVSDIDEQRWDRVDKVIDPLNEPQATALCSGLGQAAVTMLSLLGDKECTLERYEKIRQRLQLSISRALRELRHLQEMPGKNQKPLKPSPFSNARWSITSSPARSLQELEETGDADFNIDFLREKFKNVIDDDDVNDDDVDDDDESNDANGEQDDQDDQNDQDDVETDEEAGVQDVPESTAATVQTSKTQNEPTTAESPASPAAAKSCEQPTEPRSEPVVDQPTKNALLKTLIDHLHLTQFDEPVDS